MNPVVISLPWPLDAGITSVTTTPGCVDHELSDIFSFLNFEVWFHSGSQTVLGLPLGFLLTFLLVQVSSLTSLLITHTLQRLSCAQGFSSQGPSVDPQVLISSTAPYAVSAIGIFSETSCLVSPKLPLTLLPLLHLPPLSRAVVLVNCH